MCFDDSDYSKFLSLPPIPHHTATLPSDLFTSLGTQGLKGIEALTLDYEVGWPVSILLSRRAITKYQLLSRLLFFSKHVELRVLSSWHHDQSTKHLDVRAHMSTSYCLRHRMLHFLQNFTYYMTLEVRDLLCEQIRDPVVISC